MYDTIKSLFAFSPFECVSKANYELSGAVRD